MAVTLEELKYNKLYKKKFYLPIDKKNKKKNSAILLLTPNLNSSIALMNHPLAINYAKSYISYYVEKDITYTINHESRLLEIDHYDYNNIINEQPEIFTETTDIRMYNNEDNFINETYCQCGDKVIFFNELYDESIMNEVTNYNRRYRTLLYNDRIRNNKEVFNIYNEVKEKCPWIKNTYINYSRYNNLNLFVDLNYYNQAFLKNNSFRASRSVDMYFEFIRRFINDRRISNAGYTKKTVFIPVNDWEYNKNKYTLFDYNNILNPISVFYKKLRFNPNEFKVFEGIDFVFFGRNGYFKMNYKEISNMKHNLFIRLIKSLEDNSIIDDSDTRDVSPEVIKTNIINTIEKNKGIKIHNLTGEKVSDNETEALKAELVKKIDDAAKDSADEDETLDKLDDDATVKQIISDLEDEADDNIKLSASRVNRINKAQDDLMKKKINNKSIKEMINEGNKPKELPETELPIKTINKEWKHLKAINFEKEYDLNADIIACLNSLSDLEKRYPVSILNIDIEDTSTTEDSIYTYTVKCESYAGKRFTLKFDIPKFRDNRFMRLRGNEKIFSGEMPLIPISKTSESTSQVVTFYNKILVNTYYTSAGRLNPYEDKLLKALKKYSGKDIQVFAGDNSRISAKYDLPIDYIDMTNNYNTIKYYSRYKKCFVTIYFNQDEIREKFKVDESKGIPIAVADNKSHDIIYYDGSVGKTCSEHIAILLSEVDSFKELYDNAKEGKKYTYSRASILNTDIPVIVVLAHCYGLTKTLDAAGIKYTFVDKRPKNIVDDDFIRFEDGYLVYDKTYDSMMLMNGLKDCDTEAYSFKQVNNKAMWVEQLDNFGGRIKSDGLDNFKDLMFDPITIQVCDVYKLPNNFLDAMIYASNLLVDNKYIRHVDLSSNRYRTNEVVAAQFYRVLTDSYKDYALMNKRGKDATMSMKQSAVIDLILASNTTSDLSIFQPLSEIECKNAVSTKGVTGMNSPRAYSADKRGFDDTMLNNLAQATGFASTVGINRQMTINPNIVGGRGFFKKSGEDKMNAVNTYSMTEALSPFTVTSDDPFRNFMTFVQTSKHTTPIDYGSPLLVTTGADAAMPYLTSDMFCHKAKRNGTVKEIIPDKYLLVEYTDGSTEYVNLEERTMKNSDGGFYITLKLKTDLKVGAKVKENTILAYDKKSFSKRVGDNKQLAYNLGCIAKLCIITSEDGFEDSGKASEWLSEAMSSDIVEVSTIDLSGSTNVLYLCKVGDEVQEGDPIMIFQNAYDEEDANLLLKNLNNDDGYVSEIGRNTVKSKVTGHISDIKIYRTIDMEEITSDSLRKIVTKRENEIKKYKKIADRAENDTYATFDPVEKLPASGKLKNLDGVRIEIYMEYHDKLSVGDKVVANSANKMVLMDIYEEKDSPYTDFRPEEPIDIISSCSAIDGRMITSNIKLGALYKAMIELSRKCKDIYGMKYQNLHEMYYRDMGKK